MYHTRREVLALGAAGTLAAAGMTHAQTSRGDRDPEFRVKNGRIRQSVMGWCFKPMPALELAKHGREIRLVAIVNRSGTPRSIRHDAG